MQLIQDNKNFIYKYATNDNLLYLHFTRNLGYGISELTSDGKNILQCISSNMDKTWKSVLVLVDLGGATRPMVRPRSDRKSVFNCVFPLHHWDHNYKGWFQVDWMDDHCHKTELKTALYLNINSSSFKHWITGFKINLILLCKHPVYNVAARRNFFFFLRTYSTHLQTRPLYLLQPKLSCYGGVVWKTMHKERRY